MHKEMRLKDFKPDEHVLIVARRHWFVFFRDIVGIALLFFIPFFAIPILGVFITAGTPAAVIPSGFGFFFASFWALILWQMLFARWTDYYYDIWIVTNWRIVDIEQKGFFNRDTATLLNLDKVQDVATRLNSVIGNLLGFGDIQVQTAAAHREFVFKEASRPIEIEKTIRRAQEERLGLKPHV